jgi:hypothetical protein
MRAAAMLVGLVLIAPLPALADEAVAGKWKADLGSNVTIEMDVSADGQWSSKTSQGDAVVAQMAGTYRQTKKSPTAGSLVFTPTQSETTAQHGGSKVERDTYKLTKDGEEMRLTSGGDTMVFHKQP